MFAGTPPKGLLKGVPEFATDNAFYPKRTTIHKGDRVSLPDRRVPQHLARAKKGATPPPCSCSTRPPGRGHQGRRRRGLLVQRPAEHRDQPGRSPAPSARRSRRLASWSAPVCRSPARRSRSRCKFPKKGTYTVLCSLHTGMKGTVVVKGKKATIPTKKQDAKRIKEQAKAASKLAKKLVAGQGVPTGLPSRPATTRRASRRSRSSPPKKTVKVGQQVTFTMSNKSTEAHNVAFAPEAYASELAQSVPRPGRHRSAHGVPERAARDPAGRRRHQPRQRVREHRHARRRQGDAAPQEPTVSFSKPGTYEYYCIVHGAEMKGTITVTRDALVPHLHRSRRHRGGGSGVPDRRAGRGPRRSKTPRSARTSTPRQADREEGRQGPVRVGGVRLRGPRRQRAARAR